MRVFAAAFLILSLTGCDVLIEVALLGSSASSGLPVDEGEGRPEICESNEIPPTPEGATPEQVEAEIAALCGRN